MEDIKKAQDLHGAPAPAPERTENKPASPQAMDVVAPPPQQEGDNTAEAPADQLPVEDTKHGKHHNEHHPHEEHHANHHGGGSNAAIVATVIIVIALAALATYAFLKTQNSSHI